MLAQKRQKLIRKCCITTSPDEVDEVDGRDKGDAHWLQVVGGSAVVSNLQHGWHLEPLRLLLSPTRHLSRQYEQLSPYEKLEFALRIAKSSQVTACIFLKF
jgi:hypothetical protein